MAARPCEPRSADANAVTNRAAFGLYQIEKVVWCIDDDGTWRFPSLIRHVLALETRIDPTIRTLDGRISRLPVLLIAVIIRFGRRAKPLLRSLPVLLVRIAEQELDEAPA